MGFECPVNGIKRVIRHSFQTAGHLTVEIAQNQLIKLSEVRRSSLLDDLISRIQPQVQPPASAVSESFQLNPQRVQLPKVGKRHLTARSSHDRRTFHVVQKGAIPHPGNKECQAKCCTGPENSEEHLPAVKLKTRIDRSSAFNRNVRQNNTMEEICNKRPPLDYPFRTFFADTGNGH